jgi:hypothetical protein
MIVKINGIRWVVPKSLREIARELYIKKDMIWSARVITVQEHQTLFFLKNCLISSNSYIAKSFLSCIVSRLSGVPMAVEVVIE